MLAGRRTDRARLAHAKTNAFLVAGAELVQDGADGITTSWGFLSIYQRQLAAH
jgi:hypothetical protein